MGQRIQLRRIDAGLGQQDTGVSLPKMLAIGVIVIFGFDMLEDLFWHGRSYYKARSIRKEIRQLRRRKRS